MQAGLTAFSVFVRHLPEGCELRISNRRFNRAALRGVRYPNLFWASDSRTGRRRWRIYSVNGQCPVAITRFTGPEPVSYDDDYRYGGNVCHSDVPTNIWLPAAHAPT